MSDDRTSGPMRATAHESARHHVAGTATYTADAPPAGALTCWPVTVPHAHARILRLETDAAEAAPGVRAVLTAERIPGANDSGAIVHDEPILATDAVRYWGQPVAWIVADTADLARAAAERVAVETEPLPAILGIEAAVAAESFHGDLQRMGRGDVESALAAAPHRLEGRTSVGGQDHFYLETHASWARIDAEGHVHVVSSTQHPSETQMIVAHALGLRANDVVVTCLRMGGGFGGKETQAAPFAAVAALAAHATGRPALVRLPRDLDMTLTGKRHPFQGEWRVGFDADGRLHALAIDLFSDGGWSSDLSHPVLQRAMFHTCNAYAVPAMAVRGRVCKTNAASNTAFRGFGGPQGMVVVEDILDHVARRLGLPPEQVRERNFATDGDVTHYGQELEGVRTARIWSELHRDADVAARREALVAANAADPHRKRGLAITPVQFGISFTTTPLNQAGALVLVYADGSVQLNHGGTEMGQGLHTKMLAVAARALGVDRARIRMMPTATDKVPNTSATAASAGSDLNGQAVLEACRTIQARLAPVAAAMLRGDGTAPAAGSGMPADPGADRADGDADALAADALDPDGIRFGDDRVWHVADPATTLAFEAVVGRAYLQQVSLSATGFYRTPNLFFDKIKGSGRPFHYFAYGAAVSEVIVDGYTGEWSLERVDIVHDVGDSLNPTIDLGQIEGGFVQGMGWLTMEELVWDEAGRNRTVEPSTYKIPTTGEVPDAFHVRLLDRAAQDGVIYGSKAVGEPPFMLAISVREAIRDAVAAFGDAPPRVELAAPSTPEAILDAIDRVRARSAQGPAGSDPAGAPSAAPSDA